MHILGRSAETGKGAAAFSLSFSSDSTSAALHRTTRNSEGGMPFLCFVLSPAPERHTGGRR